MQSVTLTIDGMHCTGCTRTIDHLLRGHPDVREIEVSLDDGRARMLFDPAQATVEQLVTMIGQAADRPTRTAARAGVVPGKEESSA